MQDRFHGSACALSDKPQRANRDANRDLAARSQRASTPPPQCIDAVVHTRYSGPCVPHVVRAQATERWRGWVERAGTSAPRAPMWTSREGWLSAVRAWAHSDDLSAVRASVRASITPATLLAIAAVMAEHADHATGRHVAVTRATIAQRVGCDVRTVTTAWRVLRTARWAVEAQRGHGSEGTPSVGRRPSVYHLVSRPEPRPVHDFHLPPKGRHQNLTPVENYSPSAHARHETTQPKPKRRWRATPRPLELQRLAGQLVARSHDLGRGHIGAICDAITTAGIDPNLWSAQRITNALNHDMRRRGWSWPDHIEHPAAFLTSRLQRLDWTPPTTATTRHPITNTIRTAAEHPALVQTRAQAAPPSMVQGTRPHALKPPA